MMVLKAGGMVNDEEEEGLWTPEEAGVNRVFVRKKPAVTY
jgi:hypothetical protein